MYGPGPAHPKKKKKDHIGPRSTQAFLNRDRPILFLGWVRPAIWASPAHIFCNNNNNNNILLLLLLLLLKKQKKSKKFSKSFQKIVIFSNIFLPILHNIGLYIYTVKYKSDIKIPGFLRNIFLKKFKTF